jgi:subtilisin family serine protease
MRFNTIGSIAFICIAFLFSLMAAGQTSEQRTRLLEMAETFSARFEQEKAEAVEFANRVGIPFRQELKADEKSIFINGYRIIRGERPPINYDAVHSDAFDKGILIIKFRDHLGGHLEDNPPALDRADHVTFHLAEIDRLNVRFGVRQVRQHYLSPALNNTFTERHRAWGFHLWYVLRVDDDTNILEMRREYAKLAELEIAEPSFRKQLYPVNEQVKVSPQVIQSADEDNSRSWTPDDPSFANQWHYYNTGQQNGTPDVDIDLIEAWIIEKGHPSVVVAVIDDGIQFDHPDLAGNMWQNNTGHYGYNFVDNNTTIVPGNHGTHVAGTVAAVTNNAVGVAGVAGGSGSGDGVRLMSCQVFTSSSNGGFHLAPLFAADNGAAISQNSWGYNSPNVYNQSELDAIDYFNANGGGNVMDGGITIFAAGNSNSSENYYPGYYSGALAVAATNNNDVRSYYSNYGTWVDISAPGGETISVTERGVLSTLTNSNYGYYQGTSMACPHVSGVAALLASYAYRNSYILENGEVWGILIDNVDDHYPQNPSYTGQLGSGRLNAFLALTDLGNILSGVINPSNFTALAFGDDLIELSWTPNSSNHDVMLAWTSYGDFGMPQNGVAYSAGDILPGGGTVLYRGAATSYMHTGLDAGTAYHYKAFSVNESNEYSTGRTTVAKTYFAEPPRMLSAIINEMTSVDLSWFSPILDDGFENYSDFALSFGNFIQHDIDGSATYSIINTTFPNQEYTGSFIIFNPSNTDPPLGGSWAPFEGQKYAACFSATTPPNNDWLITPKITVLPDEQFSFWAKSVTDQYGLERFRVGVSTTGTQPGDFIIISSGTYIEAPNTWTNFIYSLADYEGQEIYLAINCVSHDAFAFLVDKIEIINISEQQNSNIQSEFTHIENISNAYSRSVGDPGPVVSYPKDNNSRSFGSYRIFRNNELIGTTQEFTYTDQLLAPGEYSYVIRANYNDPDFLSSASNTAEVEINTRGWTGVTGTDWSAETNWLGSLVPAIGENIYIPFTGVASFPVLSGEAEVSDMTIASGALMTIAGPGELTVTGSLTNNSGASGLTIQSDASSTASLIHFNPGVEATVERYIAGADDWSGEAIDWHFLAAPVIGQAISGDWTPSGAAGDYDFYAWDESQAEYPWRNQKDGGNGITHFTNGAGYLSAYEQTGTKQFLGVLHAGTVTVTLQRQGTQSWKGCNLLGNPYPSAIDWHLADRSNFADDFAYIYDRSANSGGGGYMYVDGGYVDALIPTHQGFFVLVGENSNGASFSFDHIMKKHGSSFMKSSGEQDMIVLKLSNEAFSDKATIRINKNSSFARDRYDAVKMHSFNRQVPHIYSLTDDNRSVAVNTIPTVNETVTIPVSLQYQSQGMMTISADDISGAFEELPVVLYDLLTDKPHNLKENPAYTFFFNPSDDPNRFILMFEAVGIDEANVNESIQIWSHGHTINLLGSKTETAFIAVYNITGQRIYNTNMVINGHRQLTLDKPAGWYLIQLIAGDEVFSRKVFLF